MLISHILEHRSTRFGLGFKLYCTSMNASFNLMLLSFLNHVSFSFFFFSCLKTLNSSSFDLNFLHNNSWNNISDINSFIRFTDLIVFAEIRVFFILLMSWNIEFKCLLPRILRIRSQHLVSSTSCSNLT